MAGNNNLHGAKNARKDEFYTQFQDIANELRHYSAHFRGKTVLCNCDDPYESNFFKYFALMFNELGLRKLIGTCYKGSPIAQTELAFPDFGCDAVAEKVARKRSRKRPAYKLELNSVSDLTGNGAAGLEDVRKWLKKKKPTMLEGNGDFRSPECVELLKEADIVVTNPPFSLFREYVAQLVKFEKKFLIIGNQNAITYKEVFPLIKENKIWLGYHSGHTLFAVPEYYDIPDFYDKSDKQKLRSNGYVIDNNGKLWRNLGNICWFTNLDHDKRHEPLDLYKHYTPEEYPRYDNYDAIEVSRTADIPCDYPGVMGVPVTFLDKFCPEQFEIVEFRKGADGKDFVYSSLSTSPQERAAILQNTRSVTSIPGMIKNAEGIINGKITYARILIRKKQ